MKQHKLNAFRNLPREIGSRLDSKIDNPRKLGKIFITKPIVSFCRQITNYIYVV